MGRKFNAQSDAFHILQLNSSQNVALHYSLTSSLDNETQLEVERTTINMRFNRPATKPRLPFLSRRSYFSFSHGVTPSFPTDIVWVEPAYRPMPTSTRPRRADRRRMSRSSSRWLTRLSRLPSIIYSSGTWRVTCLSWRARTTSRARRRCAPVRPSMLALGLISKQR